ncbi:MAG: secretion protein [Bacteroidetes bacterium]|nr:secretion protein [Bacteroidota bacterium]
MFQVFNAQIEKTEAKIWNTKELDAGRKSFGLSELEADVILEINKARTNPSKYAELYIKPRLSNYNGKVYNDKTVTKEGTVAVNDCISAMNSQVKLLPLKPDNNLIKLAKEYTKMQGKTNQTGHETDGKGFKERMKTIIDDNKVVGENISYGRNTARDIVIAQLIDDGRPKRGHRKNILRANYTHIGVASGEHKEYSTMCTINFFGDNT